MKSSQVICSRTKVIRMFASPFMVQMVVSIHTAQAFTMAAMDLDTQTSGELFSQVQIWQI